MSVLSLLPNAAPRGGWQLTEALALPVEDDSRLQVAQEGSREGPSLGRVWGSVHVRVCVLGSQGTAFLYFVGTGICLYPTLFPRPEVEIACPACPCQNMGVQVRVLMTMRF